ncbi:MAG: hypothetical protein FWG42_09540, partial [Clostridiales bacterium]|nr:hypothetical protein [Clostridiales bacterium]
GELSVDDAQYMRSGDPVSVTLSGKSKPVDGLVIKSISRDEGKARVIADLPDSADAYPGQKATLSHEMRSEEYRNVVPLSAIRGNEEAYYVYVVRDVKGVLGVQETAAKAEITLIEKDNQNAAIEGGFTGDDLIISKSNKTITEGDRIRVQSADVGT